jgi:toxin ParE1/3/4
MDEPESDPAPAHHQVQITAQAKQDLRAIVRYVAQHDSPGKAERLLDKILETWGGLARQPDQGAWPPELLALGVRSYRQVHLTPYRVIYRFVGQKVVVLVIADGRRNLKALLERRLLGAP